MAHQAIYVCCHLGAFQVQRLCRWPTANPKGWDLGRSPGGVIFGLASDVRSLNYIRRSVARTRSWSVMQRGYWTKKGQGLLHYGRAIHASFILHHVFCGFGESLNLSASSGLLVVFLQRAEKVFRTTRKGVSTVLAPRETLAPFRQPSCFFCMICYWILSCLRAYVAASNHDLRYRLSKISTSCSERRSRGRHEASYHVNPCLWKREREREHC